MSDVLILKNRYQTIKSLDSVMNAMLIVTASKTQKAKSKFYNARKYSDSIKELARQVCAVEEEKEKSKDNMLVVITTNKGLCGNFNDKIIGSVLNYRKQNEGNYEIYALGSNSKRLGKYNFNIVEENADIVHKPDYEKVSSIASELLKWHKKTNGNLLIAYNEYKSIMIQNPVIKKILPIFGTPVDKFIIEPCSGEISEAMMQHYIMSMLYRSILESELGELNSRMFVVKSATDNSKKILKDLTIHINKARQLVITSELSEIVSSFEALKEGEE